MLNPVCPTLEALRLPCGKDKQSVSPRKEYIVPERASRITAARHRGSIQPSLAVFKLFCLHFRYWNFSGFKSWRQRLEKRLLSICTFLLPTGHWPIENWINKAKPYLPANVRIVFYWQKFNWEKYCSKRSYMTICTHARYTGRAV